MKSYRIDASNRIVFSPEMKIVELIDADYELLTLLLRLEVQLPFGDISIEEMCHRYDMSSAMFLEICRIYANPDYEPSVEALVADDLLHLLRYLRSSHRYYLLSLLPAIERGVESVLQGCEPRQSAILRKFYADYADEVRAHLEYEERVIFPYVERVVKGQSSGSMAESMAAHTDICEKVEDIKSIIIKYLPESCSTQERCGLLFDLYRMRDDLAKHTLVEMKLLTPLVIAEENRRCDETK